MYKCKLFYYDEYEACIGRMLEPVGNCATELTPATRRYKYEKVKNYFSEITLETEREAEEWGQEQMYIDTEIEGYDIELTNHKSK